MARPLPFVVWPRCALQPIDYNPGFDPQDGGGEQLTLSGRNYNSSLGRGIWRPVFSSISVFKSRRVNMWKALGAQIGGRNMPILVPYYHFGFGPFLEKQAGIDFSDGVIFSDGAAFSGFIARANVNMAAAAGSVSLKVSKEYCSEILSGHAFSINGRLYEVRFVSEQTSDTATLEIQPELRVDVQQGEFVDFQTPSVFCRMLDPKAFMQTVFRGKALISSIEFIEDTSPRVGY